ncbi:hypothetical protein HDV00_003240 [Rhizophlyctis rosea]|nr:hypothetical protein HDV00_003240 [Rhizophlyctis rosea]
MDGKKTIPFQKDQITKIFEVLGQPTMTSDPAYQLLAAMLEYDPDKRITAEDALRHHYFAIDPIPSVK